MNSKCEQIRARSNVILLYALFILFSAQTTFPFPLVSCPWDKSKIDLTFHMGASDYGIRTYEKYPGITFVWLGSDHRMVHASLAWFSLLTLLATLFVSGPAEYVLWTARWPARRQH